MGEVKYVESQADFAFTEFLSRVTPRKARRDMEGGFSRSELKLRDAVMAKRKTERAYIRNEEIQVALQMARELMTKESNQ